MTPDPELSPAMLEAGLDALFGDTSVEDDPRAVVSGIYRAMVKSKGPPPMPTPELSPKTVDALAVAGKRMFETGVHPHSVYPHVIMQALLDGHREAEAEAAGPKHAPLSEYEQRGFGQRLSEALAPDVSARD